MTHLSHTLMVRRQRQETPLQGTGARKPPEETGIFIFGNGKRPSRARLAAWLMMAGASFLLPAKSALAHNVAMVETMKYLAPETVNMLVQRAKNGGPFGFQVGDTVKYIIRYRPVSNGANTGVNGYVTDYIPAGLQVIGASFVQPDGFGGYVDVTPPPPGDMSNDPACNGVRACVSATPTLPATPTNTLNVGTLAQLYGDTGIFYSTDPRTAYTPAGVGGGSNNLWDQNNVLACYGKVPAVWGAGSAVAGPDNFYKYDLSAAAGGCIVGPTTPVGPWHRIAYPGSRIGDYGRMGDLQANRVLLPGDPHYGRDLSVNPLPVSTATTPVTIRWANGLNSVGQIKYVSVTTRIVSLPPGGGIINKSEVWGGDAAYSDGGKNSPWKYNKGLVSIPNNSDLVVVKTPSVTSAAKGDVVSFQVSVVNTGALAQNNVRVVDFINASSQPGKVPPRYVNNMVTYNNDASGGALYCNPGIAGVIDPVTLPGVCDAAASEYLEWTIPLLNPGQVQTFTYSVTANGDPKGKATAATDIVHATSNTVLLPNPAQAAASFDIGAFPILSQSKTVSPASVLPGGKVRYHIQIRNTGGGSAGVYRFGVAPGTLAYPVDAAGLPIPTSIQDTLPGGFSYAGNVAASINGAPVTGMTVSALNNTVTFSIPHTALNPNEIPPNGALDLWFDAQAAPGIAPGIYTNTVYSQVPYNRKPKNKAPKAKDWATKPIWTMNTAPVTVGAIQLAKSASPASVVNTAAGASVNYAITISNQGATSATLSNLTVTDTLPFGFSYRAGSTGGTAGAAAPTVTGRDVVWSIPSLTLAAGASKTITFTADISGATLPGRYLNDVRATAANATIPPALGTAPVAVTVPGLSVSKSVDRPFIVWRGDGAVAAPWPSDTVNYTITVRNSGTAYASVDVSDQLPAGFYFPTAGAEIVTMTVGGAPTVMTRGPTDTYATYKTWPGSNPLNPLVAPGTRTPHWGTFTIPPAQNGQDSVLTIVFPVRIDMAGGAAAPLNPVVSAPGAYNNQVTLAGNGAPPPFIGAPVTIYRPASKWTTTPNVVAGGVIDYYVQIQNQDIYAWSGISVVDYLGSLNTNLAGGAPAPSGATFGPTNKAWYAIGATRPTGAPGVDPAWLPIAPTVGASTLTFTPPALTSIPAGQSLWLAYNVTAPAAAPAPATIHNSIQSLTYAPAGAIAPVTLTNVLDGGLPANNAEDVNITATPSVALTGVKTVTPGSLYLYGAASAAGALHYKITLTNPDPLVAASGVLIRDQLPNHLIGGVASGFSASSAFVTIGAVAPVAVAPVAAAAPAPANSWDIPVGAIPAGGTAVIDLYAAVPAGTAAGTYFNSVSILPDPAVPTSNVLASSFGPTAPVAIDPVHVAKQTLTPDAVAGGRADYRITITNNGDQPLTGFSLTDAFYSAAGAPSGFLYGADIAVKLNGAPLTPGVDYAPPAPGSAAPVWTFTRAIPAGTVNAPATLTIDYYATIPAATAAGVYHNSVTRMAFTPGAGLPVTAAMPFDGTLPQNFSDDVTVSSVGIAKQVVSPYQTVTVNPLTGGVTKYLITVSNPSAAPATVTVDDLLPAGFTLIDAYSATAAIAPATQPPAAPWLVTAANIAAPYAAGHPLFDNAGAGFTIPAGQNLYLWLDVAIAPATLPGSYANQASVSVGGVRSASFTGAKVNVTAPKLFISKVATTPNIGKDIYGNYLPAHYRVTVSNTGNAAATGVVLTDTLPAGFSVNTNPIVRLNGAPLTPGVDYAYSFVAPTLTVDAIPAGGFTIPAGGQLDIEYDAAIATATPAGAHVNSAVITAANAAAPAPASATVTLWDIGLSKTTSTPTINPGGTVSYAITLSNHGATALNKAIVSDYLPAGFTYVPGSTKINGVAAADPSLANGPGLPVWTNLNLPPASNTIISFKALVSNTVANGVYRNSVTATANAGAVQFPNPGPTAPVTVQTARPSLTMLKTVSIFSDPVNGATNPNAAIPGSVMEYAIVVTNGGNGSPDADSIVIDDAIPANTELFVGDLGAAGSGPVLFVDGATPSGLTYAFGGLASTLDDVAFSNTPAPGPYVFNYTPTPNASGFDPNVTAIRITPKGRMAATAAGGGNPSFQIHFRVRVK